MAGGGQRLANGLTERQEAFCQFYIIELDGQKASIMAGYSKKGAIQRGYKLLRTEPVQNRIRELKAARMRRTMITQDEVLVQWADIGCFDIRELYHEDGRMKLPQELSATAAQVVASAKVKQTKVRRYATGDEEAEEVEIHIDEVVEYKLNDKHTALTNLAKHLGMLESNDGVTELAKSFTEIMDRLAPTVGPTSELTVVGPEDLKH